MGMVEVESTGWAVGFNEWRLLPEGEGERRNPKGGLKVFKYFDQIKSRVKREKGIAQTTGTSVLSSERKKG